VLSERRVKEGVREAVRGLLVERYADFGLTLSCEKLCEVHPLEVSAETVRRLQVERLSVYPACARTEPQCGTTLIAHDG
jgi:hypothetical protein